ncbi:MAG TPA: hypothetical protein VI758_01710 [Bacteroidota bacterium]
MSRLSNDHISSLLSQYLDGVLNEQDRARVEELVAHDASVRREYDELKKIRDLLSQSTKLEPNIAFWTRLSTRIEEHKEAERLLPFPGRYLPTAALAGVVGLLLIGVVIFQNRMSLFHFMSEKSQAVQSVYEEGILKGSIYPLLSSIDNNQVLQFSLLGVLPLDAKAETSLRVDQNASNGYQIKLGKSAKKKSKPITVKDFYAEIQATDKQRQVIDSLFGLAKKRIESSVLVSDNHAVAIDPALAQLNKVMVSNIAASLEPFQRVRFGHYLEKKDAPYTFISRKVVPVDPESIYVEMNRIPSLHRFVVITADSMTYAHLNPEAIREVQRSSEAALRAGKQAEQNLEMTERLLRRYAVREPRSVRGEQIPPQPFEVWGDANTVGIDIKRELDEPRWEMREPVVIPLHRRMQGYTIATPSGRIEFGFYGDTLTANEFMMDSAMVRFFNRKSPAEYNLRTMDSIFSSFNARFQKHPGGFSLDSVLRSLEDARRRAFEEGKRQQSIQKEARAKLRDPASNNP